MAMRAWRPARLLLPRGVAVPRASRKESRKGRSGRGLDVMARGTLVDPVPGPVNCLWRSRRAQEHACQRLRSADSRLGSHDNNYTPVLFFAVLGGVVGYRPVLTVAHRFQSGWPRALLVDQVVEHRE